MNAIVSASEETQSGKSAVFTRYINVNLGSSCYNLRTRSTSNSSVVIQWVKEKLVGDNSLHPICIVQRNGDLVLGFYKNGEIMIYQLGGQQTIPLSLLHFLNDQRLLGLPNF
ncbi:hypothetical protein MKX03_032672 [Papaver bracteatum]|nr:hypothetical protein MKX03_032672 [Papaver bracteatum]